MNEASRMSAENRNQALNKAIADSDDNYVPPETVLDSLSPEAFLEQVDGPSMYRYEAKEATYTGRSVKVYGESSLDVPIRITAPGSVVEYTVEKRSYDFGLGITAKLDQGGITVVKDMAPFDGSTAISERQQKTMSDQILDVIPPSKDVLLSGRRRRAKAGLRALDKDIQLSKQQLDQLYNNRRSLEREVEDMRRQLNGSGDPSNMNGGSNAQEQPR
eukprot:CAMPEP_0178871246 /NCGR_PEP_ID=MMETSP0747-20121128/7504_1 /TAXON_ID=913974 /ORGANISM="Nitzschia punctata, Strain CCMP561" /LENGTH=216 /DNA_ID=CAMNT_0020538413 /DNA_START=13 /DNA_END=660 /DNA_ORIENTATION=+